LSSAEAVGSKIKAPHSASHINTSSSTSINNQQSIIINPTILNPSIFVFFSLWSVVCGLRARFGFGENNKK